MSTHWQTFLSTHQAHYQNGKLCDFGDAKREHLAIGKNEAVLASLEHKSLIEVSGEEAKSFLHGQFSNSLDDINENRSQLSGYSSGKGRLFAVFRLYQAQDKYYLILPKSIATNIVKKLTMFKLRAKVQITDMSEQLGIIGLAGKNADAILKKHYSNIPESVDAVAHENDYTLLRLPSDRPSYKIVASTENLQALWNKLKIDALPVGEDAWERLNIQAGIPTIHPETSEEFVAQMVNLDKLNGINFKKGCYPGQEIIARMHYLGKLKRRMFLIQGTGEAPAPATPIYDKNSKSMESVGMIVDARATNAKSYEALAVIQIESADNSELGINNSTIKIISPSSNLS